MASIPSFSRLAASVGSGAGQGFVGALLGAVFTLGLFLGIARFDLTVPAQAQADLMDLRVVSVPEPPPPPREVPREQSPVDQPQIGFEAAPAESPVQLTLTPPDLLDLLPPTVAPPAVIQVGQLYADLKPKMDIAAMADHIYQMMEVDQIPRVLHRVTPQIPASVRQNAMMLRTSLLFVVDANGQIRNVRLARTSGNPDFDAIIMRIINEWAFSPAVHKGVKVRCLLQQTVIIKWSGGSAFEL